MTEDKVRVQPRAGRTAIAGPGNLQQLSPEAEITLRRIAVAIGGERFPAGPVRTLVDLGLIEKFRNGWRLTPLGRKHHGSLAKPLLHKRSPLPDEIERTLGTYDPGPNTKSEQDFRDQ